MKKKKLTVSSIITAFVVWGIAGYFVNACWEGLSQEFVENEWKTVRGKVLDPDIKLEGKKSIERISEGIEQTINYEYTMDGHTYRSNSVSRELYVSREDYPEGKAINVFVNPRNISDSILVRTPVRKQYLYGMIMFCAVAIIATFFSLIRDFRNA